MVAFMTTYAKHQFDLIIMSLICAIYFKIKIKTVLHEWFVSVVNDRE